MTSGCIRGEEDERFRRKQGFLLCPRRKEKNNNNVVLCLCVREKRCLPLTPPFFLGGGREPENPICRVQRPSYRKTNRRDIGAQPPTPSTSFSPSGSETPPSSSSPSPPPGTCVIEDVRISHAHSFFCIAVSGPVFHPTHPYPLPKYPKSWRGVKNAVIITQATTCITNSPIINRSKKKTRKARAREDTRRQMQTPADARSDKKSLAGRRRQKRKENRLWVNRSET